MAGGFPAKFRCCAQALRLRGPASVLQRGTIFGLAGRCDRDLNPQIRSLDVNRLYHLYHLNRPSRL
jgi:hypothetical protein